MPSRGELISAGFAGLAGILETSSEEDEHVETQAGTPAKAQEAQTAVDAASKSLNKTMHAADRGGGMHRTDANVSSETGVIDDDVLTAFSPAGLMGQSARSPRPRTAAERKDDLYSDQLGNADRLLCNIPDHDKPCRQDAASLLPRPRFPIGGPALGDGAITTSEVEDDNVDRDSLAPNLHCPSPQLHDHEFTVPSSLPKASSDRRGPETPSTSRLPIFDSDSEDSQSSPQAVHSENSRTSKPTEHTSPINDAMEAQWDDPSISRNRTSVRVGSDTGDNNVVGRTGRGAGNTATVGGGRVSTPVHGRRYLGDAAPRSGDHGTVKDAEDVGMSFGLTDDMLLPPLDTETLMPGAFGRSQVRDPSPATSSSVLPHPKSGPGQAVPSSRARSPPEGQMPASGRSGTTGGTAPLMQVLGHTQHNTPAEPHPAPKHVLRPIATPAQQLRQKDEMIAALNVKLHMLEARVAQLQTEIETQVAAAEQSGRTAAEAEHESLKEAVAQARHEVEAAKDHAARREAAVQKQLRKLQLADSVAADDAAAEVARVRDQAARDIRDADSRARLRIDAELANLKSQLEAEAAGVKDQRALLERNRQSAETLASLSARVEVASSAAIQREERLASRLEVDLHERERRCQQREVAVSQREAAIASAEQDGDVLRKQLLELSAKAQAAASQDAVAAAEDRRRLQHDAARLDAAVNALEQQRQEIAAGIDMERQTLQATRAARDEERKRFMQEVTEERRRLAEERTAAWGDMDRIHSEAAQAQRKLVELEAQSAAALLEASKARDAKAAADMDMRQAKGNLRTQQQQLEANHMAVENERAALLNDTQILHASTQQLRELRDAVSEEKQAVLKTMRQLEETRAAVRTEQAAVEAQNATIAAAERKVDELRIKVSEKRALLSNETVKLGKVQAAWHSLREQIYHQLREWSSQHHSALPSSSVMWDMLVTIDDGQKVIAVPRAPDPNVQPSRATLDNREDNTGQRESGKENVQLEQMSFLTQKLSVLESIIKKRRSLPRQHDVNLNFMAEIGKRHRQLGISETLAWGRQMHAPVFPVHDISGSQSIIQHPSPMQTPRQPANLSVAAVRVNNAQARQAVGSQAVLAPVDWKVSAMPVNPESTEHVTNSTNPRFSSLPTGFVPLQPVSTTEDSFSYRGSLEQSRASRQQSPPVSQHITESATSQDHVSQDHQDSPGTEAARN